MRAPRPAGSRRTRYGFPHREATMPVTVRPAAPADPERKGPYYLACDGADVVGQMQITYEFSDWRNGWFWWIQGVYVRADARGRGVFRALYHHVYEAARRDTQVIGLRLYVEKENHAAQRTYFNLGMKETDYLMLERFPL